VNRVRALGVLILASAPVPALAGGAATDAYDGIRHDAAIDLHGLADVYGLHNFNLPASGTNQFRAFDVHSDRPYIGLLRATLARYPRWLGFRVDLGIGETADDYYREDPGAAADPDLARALSHVGQAFVSAAIAVGRGLQIDVGKFGTPVGFEDNEAISNWNYSRGLLYLFAEPSVHTGARASLRATSALSLSAFLVNGWNSNVVGGNGMRTFAGAASLRPRDGLEMTLVYMGGLERAPTRLSDPTLTFRSVLDAYVSYAPIRQLSLAVAGDYGNDQYGNGASWYGLSGYARIQPRPWFAAAVRAEVLTDPQGFLTGTRQSQGEVTATLELQRRVGPARYVTRLEYRHDQSTAFVYESGIGYSRSLQDTLTLALLGEI
jgi:hypothetical protein